MKELRVCPKCGSFNVQREMRELLADLAGVQPVFVCQSCGFSSSLFPVADVQEKKIKKRKII